MGNAHMHLVPYQTFETADGHIIVAVGNDRQFRALCGLAGNPALADDPRFAANRDRVVNRNALIPLLAAAFRTRGSAEWLSLLEAATIPCGAVNTIDQVFAMEQVKDRGLELRLRRADGTSTPGLANPIKYSATPLEQSRAAPALGADTDAVLTRLLRLDQARLAELRSLGVIG
jgi:crotonobetainyl-CoA:carnitine CoA-transferase CaiB-like acyl-CoA transferase